MESRMINKGGDEMMKSLEILCNRIEQEEIMRKQW